MRIQALFLCSIFCPLVACGPATLTTSAPEAAEGMIDTDGDGIPDSPDSDGDGIADEDDPNPDTPDSPEDEDEDEEEENQPNPYEGEYTDGGIQLLIDWKSAGVYDYCDENETEFEVFEDGELSGEGWCYNYYFQAELEISYSGSVSNSGDVEGGVNMLMWVRTGGGHGSSWAQEEFEFGLDGGFYSDKLVLEWDGEIEFGREDYEVEGSAWADD